MAGDMLRDLVAHTRGTVLEVEEVEPADYFAVVDEDVEGNSACLLLAEQIPVPLSEVVEELVATIGGSGLSRSRTRIAWA